MTILPLIVPPKPWPWPWLWLNHDVALEGGNEKTERKCTPQIFYGLPVHRRPVLPVPAHETAADNYRKLTYLCSAQVFAFPRGGSRMGSRTEAQLGDDEATAKVAELTVIERIKGAVIWTSV